MLILNIPTATRIGDFATVNAPTVAITQNRQAPTFDKPGSARIELYGEKPPAITISTIRHWSNGTTREWPRIITRYCPKSLPKSHGRIAINAGAAPTKKTQTNLSKYKSPVLFEPHIRL